MRRFAAPLLGALLVLAGVPGMPGLPIFGAATAGMHGADCQMACCKTARAGAGTGDGMSARASSPSSPSSPTCRMGCSRGQQAGLVEPMPSLLAAPPRLPAPTAGFFAAPQQDFAPILRPSDLPERPPRAA
jgi:hypothetical protein